MASNIDILDKLHPDLITAYLETGRCDGIPEDVQLFLKQIQWAAELYEYERNITRCASQLRTRIIAQQKILIDVRTCKARIYAAINYFSIDNNVAIKVWESNFADKYEDLAKYASSLNDVKTQMRCYERAIECRRRASEAADIDKEWAPIFIIDCKVSAEQLGFQKKSLREIARKNNEGYYLQLINDLPIEKDDKKRLLRDADIQDVEEEQIEEAFE